MNINMANLRRLDLFGHSDIAGKLSSGKAVNVAGIADAKVSKEILGFSVSISKESKTMLKQLNEEKKQRDQDSVSENESQRDQDSLSENKSITIDGKNYKILEGTMSYASNKSRMVHAAWQGNDLQNAGTLSFNSLASAYEEIRKEFESQYTGEELEGHLNLLDADYKDAVDDITESVKYAIKFRAAIEGKEGGRKAIEAIFGMNMNDILSKMGVGENQLFGDSDMDSFDAIIKALAQTAKESGKI